MNADTTPTRRSPKLLKARQLKAFCHLRGRRVGAPFLDVLEAHVCRKLEAACRVHNGGKITLDATIAGHVGICS